MSPDVIFGSIGVVLFAAIVFEVWKYVRGHPQALASVEKELAQLKGQVSTSASADAAAIHAKLDALTTKVDATHAAVLAPVSVTVVPATSTGTITDKLFPQAPATPTQAPKASTTVALDPNTIYYYHHKPEHFTVGTTPSYYTTEALTGPTMVQATYCENSPSTLWIWDASQSRDMPAGTQPQQFGVSAQLQLPQASGTFVVGFLADRNGLADLQLQRIG